jgi:hypothetical protein
MQKLDRFFQLFVILTSIACLALALYTMATGRRGVGYASLGMLAICYRWLIAKKRPSPWFITPGILLVLFYVWRSQLFSHTGTSESHPLTFDLYALYVDGSFGVQPSVWVSQLARPTILREVFQAIYEGLPFAMGTAYAAFVEEPLKAARVFACFLLAGVLGVPCYRLMPVCGPAYLPFGDECFYFRGNCATSSFFSGTPALIEIDTQWPRNAMPSLHMSWALLIWWSCRNRNYGKWIAFVFTCLTAISTMVYGEHYLVDLLAASFFSLIPWSTCLGDGPFAAPGRAFVIASGALGYISWIMLIRYGARLFWLSAAVPWAALLISLLVPVWIVFFWQDERSAP